MSCQARRHRGRRRRARLGLGCQRRAAAALHKPCHVCLHACMAEPEQEVCGGTHEGTVLQLGAVALQGGPGPGCFGHSLGRAQATSAGSSSHFPAPNKS